jgi:hypothetical protein
VRDDHRLLCALIRHGVIACLIVALPG